MVDYNPSPRTSKFFAMPKSRTYSSSGPRDGRRHNPLSDDIVATGPLREKTKKRKIRPEDAEEKFVDSGSSRKILKIGQDLLEEEQEENAATAPNPAFTFESRFGDESEPEEDATIDNEEAWGDEEEIVEELVRSFHATASSRTHADETAA